MSDWADDNFFLYIYLKEHTFQKVYSKWMFSFSEIIVKWPTSLKTNIASKFFINRRRLIFYVCIWLNFQILLFNCLIILFFLRRGGGGEVGEFQFRQIIRLFTIIEQQLKSYQTSSQTQEKAFEAKYKIWRKLLQTIVSQTDWFILLIAIKAWV